MNKKFKVLIAVALVTTLCATAVLAAGTVPFDITSTGGFKSSPQTNAAGSKWRVRIDYIENHGVGIVFLEDKWTWASALYTYNVNTKGWRNAKSYSPNVSEGTPIYWRMRLDNDYSGTFICRGVFEP